MNGTEIDSLRDKICSNIDQVRRRIAWACARSGRDTGEVKLIAVSKNFSAEIVRLGLQCGLRNFGENKVQEAYTKFKELDDIRASFTLHFVGHLQTNKVKDALEIVDIIHSIDSLRLANEVNERAGRTIPALVQVNIAAEKSKSGFLDDEVKGAVKHIRSLRNIELLGFMTIAPIMKDTEGARPVFSHLRELRDTYGLTELSMGMTDDFEVAVEEGSTMVRIGKAIFGKRS